jgi:hypothetical protein
VALLTTQQVAMTGLAPTYSAVTASDTIPTESDGMFLHVKNANASPCTVTITDNSRTVAGAASANFSVSVPATTGDRLIGPIPRAAASSGAGTITVTYSPTSSVTAALFRLT